MYSTCLFCTAHLGANREIEHFAVGRRLAFHSARGRLWVVCGRCGRWNLTPLEERWEAIEECERLFATTPTRYSTEQIGLARTGSGLELVRVGEPQRPEFAAWRYGDRLRSRYRRTMLWSGGTTTVLLATHLLGGTVSSLVTGGLYTVIMGAMVWSTVARRRSRPVVQLRTAESETRTIREEHAEEARLVPADGAPGWKLQVPHATGMVEVWGRAAERAVGPLLAYRNMAGGAEATVQAAVRELERHRDPDACFAAAASLLRDRPLAAAVESRRYRIEHLPQEVSLALEMAAHETVERRALEGELRELEAAWREAEAIAAIADRLALPPAVERLLGRSRAPELRVPG